MVRYVDLVVRRLGNPKQRAKSLGNYVGERLGKLFGRDSISKAPANIVAIVHNVTPSKEFLCSAKNFFVLLCAALFQTCPLGRRTHRHPLTWGCGSHPRRIVRK
jgi:hypothetical protein